MIKGILILLMAFIMGCTSSGSFEEISENYHKGNPLAEVYKDYFAIGAAVNGGDPSSFDHYPDHVLAAFNSLVAENHMKPEVIHPRNEGIEDDYDWAKADKIAAYARENNFLLRGHTLVWHNQTPEWMTAGSREESRRILKEHITAVAGRYKDDVYAWDVVNEAVSHRSLYNENSPWFKAYGDASYITDAFDFAHEADPDGLLFYNDYGLHQPKKRQNAVDMIRELKLIEEHHLTGIGLQGHWNLKSPTVDEIQETIDTFADMGLEIHITELDIDVYSSKNKAEKAYDPALESRLAARYREIFEVFRKNKDVITNVTFWGVADDGTWLNYYLNGHYTPGVTRQNYPLPFSTDHKAKAAYKAIAEFE